MQIDFRNTLINQNDPKLAELLSISQSTLKNRFRDNVENYDDQIDQLKYFLTKDYVRTYINLKNRHRYFVMLFIRGFKSTLAELKILVEDELKKLENCFFLYMFAFKQANLSNYDIYNYNKTFWIDA